MSLIDNEAEDEYITRTGASRERVDEALVDVLTTEDINFINDVVEDTCCSPSYYRRFDGNNSQIGSSSNQSARNLTAPDKSQVDESVLCIPKPVVKNKVYSHKTGKTTNFNDAVYVYHFRSFSTQAKEKFKKEIEKKYKKPVPSFLDYSENLSREFISSLPRIYPTYDYSSYSSSEVKDLSEKPKTQNSAHENDASFSFPSSPSFTTHVNSVVHERTIEQTSKGGSGAPPMPNMDNDKVLMAMLDVCNEDERIEYKLFNILKFWDVRRAGFITTRVVEKFRNQLKNWIENPNRIKHIVEKELKNLKIRTSKRTRGRRGGVNRKVDGKKKGKVTARSSSFKRKGK